MFWLNMSPLKLKDNKVISIVFFFFNWHLGTLENSIFNRCYDAESSSISMQDHSGNYDIMSRYRSLKVNFFMWQIPQVSCCGKCVVQLYIFLWGSYTLLKLKCSSLFIQRASKMKGRMSTIAISASGINLMKKKKDQFLYIEIELPFDNYLIINVMHK